MMKQSKKAFLPTFQIFRALISVLGALTLTGCVDSVNDAKESPHGKGEKIQTVAVEEAQVSSSDRYQKVLAMRPAGYWPLDQGEGKMVSDLSNTRNNGVIHHVPWDQQRHLLNFTGAYQWLEIPKHEAYQTPAFSTGGWVFVRSEVIGSGWVNRQGLQLIGNRETTPGWAPDAGVQLCVRKQEVVDVVSDGKEDVLGTRLWVENRDGQNINRSEGKPSLAVGQWHHLLYSFEPNSSPSQGEAIVGSGKLYLNGELIASKTKINYLPSNANLQIGNDAYWWMQTNAKSGSLDGTVRDMVWFDRVLSGDEAAQLHTITKPTVMPDVYDDTVVVLDGRGITVKDLASLSPPSRQTALQLFGLKTTATLQPMAEGFLPILTAALSEPKCRLSAINLLLKLDTPAANAALKGALQPLTAVVQGRESSEQERADAALALAAMGKIAVEAMPALADILDELVPNAGIQLPGTEELLRNALTRALLDIDNEHIRAQQVLTRTFAKPMIEALDLGRPELAKQARLSELLSMVDAGQYLKAMRLYSQLPATVREHFFTYKLPEDRDYSASTQFKGATYKVGEGVAWKGVEKVLKDDYMAVVAELAKDHPTAKNWRKTDYEHLYRVPITKISADGKEQKIYLEGRNFILDGADAKCRGWSIFIDERGYIHVIGGQHNVPNSDYYIPGSWEKMGVGRDKNSADYPLQMYWVSTQPESIDSFKFAGQRSNPRSIPTGYLNYMVFVQNPSNETFLSGRIDGLGWQSWGLFRYAADVERWIAIGGDPYDVIESARREDPAWLDYLHDNVRGSVPDKPTEARPLVWAWQPPFYNFCRDHWGVRFDKTGRMHVRMQISGLDGAGYVRPTSVYAWSDDRGQTFHRVDGTVVKLPLTVNPAPEHNAEIATDNALQHHSGGQYDARKWWELWLGLLEEAGFKI